MLARILQRNKMNGIIRRFFRLRYMIRGLIAPKGCLRVGQLEKPVAAQSKKLEARMRGTDDCCPSLRLKVWQAPGELLVQVCVQSLKNLES